MDTTPQDSGATESDSLLDEVELAAEDLIDHDEADNDPEADVETEDDTQSEDDTEAEADESEQTDEADTEDAEGSEESEDTESEPDEEAQRKAANDAMAKARIEAKQAREAKIREDQNEYVTDGEDERDTALRQLQVEAYNTRVDTNSSKLTTGYERAVKDFDILSSTDPAIKAEVDAAIDAFQAQQVTIDQYGNPYEIRGDFYQALKNKAESLERLSGMRSKQQASSKAKEKSKTMPRPSRAAKEPAKDPMIEAFEEEAFGPGY